MTATDDLPTAAKLDAARRLVEHLQATIGDLDAKAAEAREARAEVALDAHEGNQEAKKALLAARKRAADAQLEREEAEDALARARERVTALEAESEAEAKEEERRRIIGLCDRRLHLAEAIDRTLGDLTAVVDAWMKLGVVLSGLRRKRWRERLEDQDFVGPDTKRALARALPPTLVQAVGLETPFYGSEWLPLVSLDEAGPVKRWLEDAAEDDEPDQGAGRPAEAA